MHCTKYKHLHDKTQLLCCIVNVDMSCLHGRPMSCYSFNPCKINFARLPIVSGSFVCIGLIVYKIEYIRFPSNIVGGGGAI